jgi:hypothetical protein
MSRYFRLLNVDHWFVLNVEVVDHYLVTFVVVMVVKLIVDVRFEQVHEVRVMELVLLMSTNLYLEFVFD